MEGKIILYVLLLGGMGSYAPFVITSPYPSRGPEEKERCREGREEGHGPLGISNGHLPPPGHCRIWYPGRPAGQQPPPQRCPIALNRVLLGAWVVSRGSEATQFIVNLYHGQKPGVVVGTRYFTAGD
jgi:hypothetical protein